jgi:hypothetical protein
MEEALQIPEDFGGSWELFSHEWCPEAPLANSPAEVASALSALKRLWPEGVRQLSEGPHRGVWFMAPAIELGRLLATCETINRFPGVLRRLVNGERSAYSELVLGAALIRLGYLPQFSPPVGSNVLDAECVVEETRVLFEVYAPDRAVATISQMKLLTELNHAVRSQALQCRIEIEITEEFDRNSLSTIIAAIEMAPPMTWVASNWGRLRRIDYGQELLPQFDGTSSGQLIIPNQSNLQDHSTVVIARCAIADNRAERKLEEKRRQMPAETANIVVMNVTEVFGMDAWAMQLAQMPWSGYERIGAIAFFEERNFMHNAMRRRWRVLINPRARVPIPERLLAGLESLDESKFWSASAKTRLYADPMADGISY